MRRLAAALILAGVALATLRPRPALTAWGYSISRTVH